MTGKIIIQISSEQRKNLKEWGLRTGQFQKAAADAWKHKMDKLKDQSKPLDVEDQNLPPFFQDYSDT